MELRNFNSIDLDIVRLSLEHLVKHGVLFKDDILNICKKQGVTDEIYAQDIYYILLEYKSGIENPIPGSMTKNKNSASHLQTEFYKKTANKLVIDNNRLDIKDEESQSNIEYSKQAMKDSKFAKRTSILAMLLSLLMLLLQGLALLLRALD